LISRGISCIYSKEIKSYFASPIAYVVIVAFLLLTGNFFYGTLVDFQRNTMQLYSSQHLNVNDMIVRPTLYNISVLLLFIVPLITMRGYAEEKKEGTLEFLQTAPISSTEVVIGKYLGSLTIFSIMLLSTFVYPIILMFLGNPDIATIFSGYLGLLLLGSFFTAVGLFNSSLTENQVVSAVLTFGMLLILWILGWVSGQADSMAIQKLGTFSVLEHLSGIIRGLIDTKDIFYFLSGTVFFLFLTNRSLQPE